MWEVERQEGERERDREERGLCRACELSSGRRRHWKNRTEINRSVFFAELEHELSLSRLFFHNFLSSLVPVPPAFRRPTRFASFYHPISISLPPPPSPPPAPRPLLLVFQHFSFLPPPLLLPRLAPFLSQAPGVYSVIARPSRTSIARVPPYSAFSAVNILSHYIFITSAFAPRYARDTAILWTISNQLQIFIIAARMFSSVINVNFNMQLFFP